MASILDLVGRILISEISSLYAHLEYFSFPEEHLGFKSLSNFLNSLFNTTNPGRSGRIILENYASSWVEQGFGGVLNTIFLGEAWANFGFIGILISPLWTGFIIGVCYYMFLKLEKTPIYLGLFMYFSYKTSICAGINDYIYNSKLLIVFIIFLFVILSGKELKKIKIKKISMRN